MLNSRGVRTRDMLIAAMALVIVSATLASLLIVRHRLEDEVTSDLSADLVHSLTTFENLQKQKLSALERENSLLADLPSLKALMTTSDDPTIQNGAIEFWRVSGNDLFALANNEGRVVALDTTDRQTDTGLNAGLQTLLADPARHYLVSENRLFACSVRPLYFGSERNGTLLGYVINGFAIDRNAVEQIGRLTNTEATFTSDRRAVASTLAPSIQTELAAHPIFLSPANKPAPMKVGGHLYLGVTRNLSSDASAPLRLTVLKSFDQAERSIRQIDHVLLVAGLLAMLLGAALMMALSRAVTGPLEQLASGVRAFGIGDSAHVLPHRGTREVRELSRSFAGMRLEIQQANRARLEAERLATIGRMASSVSHDLRHYLAAVYANAEFLTSADLPEKERREIFGDIRMAVHGTTELLESLLIFSRTGSAIHRSNIAMSTLLERAVGMVRAHPDAAAVNLIVQYDGAAETSSAVDGKQIERAIYNLLLNACQATRFNMGNAQVVATLYAKDGKVFLQVKDNGAGVPEHIRTTLFEPFVSEGKQRGSGLGLTMVHCIAVEHGGEVVLVSSRPGETVFQMSVAREFVEQAAPTG